jgi:LAO/AO transport system kinase
VGAGQAEVEVMDLVDAVVLVLAPGLGDHVQALKAGILDVADLVVVNKSDLGGAELVLRDLEDAQSLRREGLPRPATLQVSVKTGAGLAALGDALEACLDAKRNSSARPGVIARRRVLAWRGRSWCPLIF